MKLFITLFFLLIILISAVSSQAAIIISEVHSSGSGNAPYEADFFELTNTGTTAVDITDWKMDDNSNEFTAAVKLRGVASIAPGQSIVFIESDTLGSEDAALQAGFKDAWFGTNDPADLIIGNYGGKGVGLSTSGDAVNIFDSAGSWVTGIQFGAATTFVTFDNAIGLGSTTLPLPSVSTLSVVGVNGAFLSPAGEIGSPGTVPEPATMALMGLGCLVFARKR